MADRDPPAFLEYAATVLALMAFRLMSLAERGLFYTMRLECWINTRLPSDPAALGRVLGLSRQEIDDTLTENVMFFFRVDGDTIFCPELEGYREKLNRQHEAKSKGGKQSADKINRMRKAASKRAKSGDEGKPTANPQLSSGQADRSLDQTSSIQTNSNQSSNGGNSDDWLHDYEKGEGAADYAKASGR